jgi:hypothetical protein
MAAAILNSRLSAPDIFPTAMRTRRIFGLREKGHGVRNLRRGFSGKALGLLAWFFVSQSVRVSNPAVSG